MIRETFVNYKGFRWLWANLLFVTALIVLYVFDHPLGGRNGGTIYGYAVGGLAAAGIVYLMCYGIRKRSYHSRDTTLKGWLAAHVWLGISLALIVPLHAGFSFGINVHTLAYALMLLTIMSGIWGALNFETLAPEIQSHRGGGSLKSLLRQIEVISTDIEKLAQGKSDALVRLLNQVDFKFQVKYWKLLFGAREEPVNRSAASKFLAAMPDSEREEGVKLIGLVNKKHDLIQRLRDELRIFFWMRIWLTFHLPLSFGLLAALCIHIFSVFFMW